MSKNTASSLPEIPSATRDWIRNFHEIKLAVLDDWLDRRANTLYESTDVIQSLVYLTVDEYLLRRNRVRARLGLTMRDLDRMVEQERLKLIESTTEVKS
jgi:hypothetical protein